MIPSKRRTQLQQTQLGLRGASTILLAALIATLLALPAAAMPSAGAKQFAALANDASGVMANPAGLIRLEGRSVLFEMTAPDPGAPDAGTTIDRLIAYGEPDTGIGAGALSMYTAPDVTQYTYTVARRISAATALGANAKHYASQGGSWWGLDLGLQHDFGAHATVGFSVLNALSSRGRGPGGTTLDPLPAGARFGVALRNTEGFFIAADYAVHDLVEAASSTVSSIVAGFEFKSLFLWGGRSARGPGLMNGYMLGMEFRSGTLQLSLAAHGIGSPSRTISIGIAHYF